MKQKFVNEEEKQGMLLCDSNLHLYINDSFTNKCVIRLPLIAFVFADTAQGSGRQLLTPGTYSDISLLYM